MDDLFDKSKLLSVWPSNDQSPKERIASSIRFVLYTTFLVYIIKRDTRVVLLGIGISFILYTMYNNGAVTSVKGAYDGNAAGYGYMGREWNPMTDGTYSSQHSFFQMPENNLDAFLKGAYPDMFRPRCRDDTASCDPDMRSEWINSRGPSRRNNGLI
jgi:hypothetical protein